MVQTAPPRAEHIAALEGLLAEAREHAACRDRECAGQRKHIENLEREIAALEGEIAGLEGILDKVRGRELYRIRTALTAFLGRSAASTGEPRERFGPSVPHEGRRSSP
jgi:hypothetical protein